MTKKTLVVGVDAACWSYLDPLLAANRMPALQKLMDEGVKGTLHSTMSAWTPTAWSSIVTGKNPGKHGIFDMIGRRPGSYEFQPINANMRQGTPFWTHLNEHDIRVGLVNIPFTYPPEAIDGFVVAGFGTPNSARDLTYPPEALSRLEEKHGLYTPTVNGKMLRSGNHQEILRVETELQNQQVKMAIDLAEQYQVDVLIINLMLPDHANHKMPELAQVEQALCQSDTDLDQLLQAFKPDNVMVISDHGSSRVKGEFLLDAWLRDQGYYVKEKRSPSDRAQALNLVLSRWLTGHHNWSGVPEKLVRRLMKTGLTVLPSALTKNLWRRLNEIMPFAREYVEFSDHPDYSRTVVFSGSVHSGHLYLNLKGREESGVIPPEQRQAILVEIKDKLAAIRDPDTGEKLFTNVYQAEELYQGQILSRAPDIIIDCFDTPWVIRQSYYAPTLETAKHQYFVGSRVDYGWHSFDGIYVFKGIDFIKKPSFSPDYELLDIPATLLHLYNIPIPEDYDGQVMTESLDPDFVSRTPIRFQDGDPVESQAVDHSYSDEESEELVEHLKALGYLE